MPEQESLIFTRPITGVVYLITNKVNGKRYVGQTFRSIKQRWREHVNAINRGGRYPVSRAIRKYGKASFEVSELDRADSLERLNELEAFHIAQLGTQKPGGYNLMVGGGNGGAHHEETKARISAANKGRNKGHPVSPETRAKISAANKGRLLGTTRIFSAEHRANMSAAKKGKPSGTKGQKRSPESRARMSIARKGKPGHPHTQEFKDKLSERNKGNTYGRDQVHSPIRNAQMSRMASARPRNANGSFQSGKMPKLETFQSP